MNKDRYTSALGIGALALTFFVGFASGHRTAELGEFPMTQATFLRHCSEDEVIGFSPRYGSELVGCLPRAEGYGSTR